MSKSHKKPNILIVIPTLGQREKLLKLTLESIAKQAPVLMDIVIIAPRNKLFIKKLAKEFGAVVLDDPGGLSKAVNLGLRYAKPYHKYMGWVNDDDLLTTNSLKTTQQALSDNPDSVLAFGRCDYIDSSGNYLFTSRAGKLAPWIMTWGPNLVPCPGALFKLSAIRKVGDFDVNNKYSMDLDMLLRLRKLGKFTYTKNTLAAFRWHEESTTVKYRAEVIKETEAVKRKYLPKSLATIASCWELPVRYATKLATVRVNRLANRTKVLST